MPTRDVPILPATRLLAAVIVPFLLLAFVLLFFLPERTGEHFAWTINPPMTAVFMGSGYLAGAYFFTRTLFARGWRQVRLAFPAIAVFVWVMAGATLLHVDRFHHGHWAFVMWAVLYAAAPIAVPWVMRANGRIIPAPDPEPDLGPPKRTTDDAVLRWQQAREELLRIFRAVAAASAAVLAVGAAALFLVPALAGEYWPWPLTPLTARVVSGWLGLSAAVFFAFWRTEDTDEWRVPLETATIWMVALLIGTFTRLGDFASWGASIVALTVIVASGNVLAVVRSIIRH